MQPGATLIFLDANILYSRTLRDWFALIALNSGPEGIGLRWSEDVLAEWLYNRRRRNPAASDQDIGLWRKKLTDAFPEAVIRGYDIDPTLVEGKDKFDAHVLAAADHGCVDYLVTNNYEDFFPYADLFEFETYVADDMLCLIMERRSDAVLAALRMQSQYWGCRDGSKTLVAALVDAGAPNFGTHIQSVLTRMAISGEY
ncbi:MULTISPECIES: PIN domain-containing protein [unclassified Arthrobacter]|uniref:PIN domain-containing protein n=1 Tax=unclassified Arthrobacter TaxID=235627 RepID=UPI00037B2A3C|nr:MULTISPECIES: PIN domain-containing protein [unclassified Arthrobacter]